MEQSSCSCWPMSVQESSGMDSTSVKTSCTKSFRMPGYVEETSFACMAAIACGCHPRWNGFFPVNRPVAVEHHGNRARFTAAVEDSSPGTNLQKELEIELEQLVLPFTSSIMSSIMTSAQPSSPGGSLR